MNTTKQIREDEIARILYEISMYWYENQHLRLGQIITNMNGGKDPFYMTDAELLDKLTPRVDYDYE